MPEGLSRSALMRYGALALPLAAAGMPLYVHVPEFYASEHGLSLVAIGGVLLLMRLLDAVQDPLIGFLSDRYRSHRLSIMLFGSLLLSIGLFALFRPPSSNLLVWFSVALLLATTGFSVVTINLNAVGALWISSQADKTRIASYREGFALAGVLLAISFPAFLMTVFSADEAFRWFTWFWLVSMVAALLLYLGWFKRQAWAEVSHERGAIGCGVLSMPLLRQLRMLPVETKRLFLIYAISTTASSIPAVLVLFYINDRLQLPSYTALFLGAYLLAAMVTLPGWQACSKKWGKAYTWSVSMVLSIVVFSGALLLEAGDGLAYLVVCLLSGAALGAELTLPISLLADQINGACTTDHGVVLRGEGSSTLQCSILAFLAKLSLALSAGLLLPLLEWVGYVSKGQNSEGVLMALTLCYAGLPVVLKCMAWMLLTRSKVEVSQA